MKKKTIFMVALAVAIGITSGCGENKQGASVGIDHVTTSDEYPIQSDAHLTYWVPLSALVSPNYKSLNDTPFAEILREKTGIDVEFIHAPHGQEGERLNLMIASNDMPDIVEAAWMDTYGGSAEQAIKDKVILRLNDIIDKCSPNFKKYIENNPDRRKQVVTDNGSYFMYPQIGRNEMLTTYQGFMIRRDLMNKVGESELPTTIDDWDRILYKFKDAGVACPLNIRSYFLGGAVPGSGIMGTYNMTGEFYIDNGKVKFGAYEPVFQDYVRKLAQWYRDGILDKEFSDNDLKRLNAIVTSGDVGMVYGSCGGEFGMWLPIMKETVPEADFVPVQYPSLEQGGRSMFGQSGNVVTNNGAAITTKCSNVEVAARLLDYGYSEEGHLVYAYGTEGISYNMVDGVPLFSEIIFEQDKNGGKSIAEGIATYSRGNYGGPFEQDEHYIMQYYQLQSQKDALSLWSDTAAQEHVMPHVSLTAEESTEYNTIMSDIRTYKDEKITKYINGQLDVENMNEFFDTLKSMKIERAIAIQQTAYNRYLQR